jgi:hypothetical protein
MPRVVSVTPLRQFQLHLQFDDGIEETVALGDHLIGAMFGPLRDWRLFRQVSIDEFGAVCWPNGADLAPDALHERLAAVIIAGAE